MWYSSGYLVQTVDVKKLVAHTSVLHMGLGTGVYVLLTCSVQAVLAVEWAAHSVAAAVIFAYVGQQYRATYSRSV